MGVCFVPHCSHNSTRDECSFYRFPKKEDLKRKWIAAVRRKDVDPSSTSRVCSCHFVDKKKINGPTIFLWNDTKRFTFKSPEKSIEKEKTENGKDLNPSSSSRIRTYRFRSTSKRNRPTFPWNAPKKNSPLSPKKYLIAVDRKHLYPTQASNIRKNRFVPILPAPSGTPTSINHNAVPSQFDSVSGDHQNKDQPSEELMETSEKIVPFEPEIILKIDNDATLSCPKETEGKLDKVVNNPDNSSCNNTNDFESLNSEEILKQKLKDMTALYEKTRKKLKLSQEQCKRYVKQVMSLEEVIENLRQIISVSDFN